MNLFYSINLFDYIQTIYQVDVNGKEVCKYRCSSDELTNQLKRILNTVDIENVYINGMKDLALEIKQSLSTEFKKTNIVIMENGEN